MQSTRHLNRGASVLTEDSGIGSIVALSQIHTQRNPSKDSILNIIPKFHVVKNRIGVHVSLDSEDSVIGVVHNLDAVVRVRRDVGVDVVDEVLVEEELADVRHVAAGQGAVGQLVGACVGDDVDVGGAAVVVAGEDGLEGCDTVGVRLGDAAEEGGVDVGGVSVVAVAAGDDAAVDAGRVAAGDIEVSALQIL